MKIPISVRRVSGKEKKNLSQRMVKLMEEAGELAAEVLKYQGQKGSKGKTKQEILADLHLEAVDTLLMAMDILVNTGASDKTITEIMESQLNKWERNIEK